MLYHAAISRDMALERDDASRRGWLTEEFPSGTFDSVRLSVGRRQSPMDTNQGSSCQSLGPPSSFRITVTLLFCRLVSIQASCSQLERPESDDEGSLVRPVSLTGAAVGTGNLRRIPTSSYVGITTCDAYLLLGILIRIIHTIPTSLTTRM